jgi:glycerol-3-phosphate dehydrogenase subunit B
MNDGILASVQSQFDIVVIGSGIAGTAAALAAARAGANVCVIAGRPGATALFSGAWKGPCRDELKQLLFDVGYELQPCKHALPHPNGSLVGCDYATAAHCGARVHGAAVVCGIAGLPGFNADGLARQWSARSGTQLASATITLAGTPAAGWAVASLAAHIERDPASFAAAIRAVAHQHKVDKVIVPAVLGTRHDSNVHLNVQAAAGCTVGEALATAPSLPGLRLHAALRAVLMRARVTVMSVDASDSSRADARVHAMIAAENTIRAQKFILATGKFVSGGIDADDSFREPLLDCPVWVEHLGEVFQAPDPLMLTDPMRTEDQPLMRMGVHAHADHRPANRVGDVVYENVFIAGSVRADWSSATHGLGHCADDGWSAGLKAVHS